MHVIFLTSLLLAIFFFDPPASYAVALAGGVLELGESWLFMRWSRRRSPDVGVEVLVGRRAVVAADCLPEGQVRVAGELWQAHCDAGATAGQEVLVREVKGLMLVVEPLPGDG
jgi:membrane protein implicated in regulation of membrane protease activity